MRPICRPQGSLSMLCNTCGLHPNSLFLPSLLTWYQSPRVRVSLGLASSSSPSLVLPRPDPRRPRLLLLLPCCSGPTRAGPASSSSAPAGPRRPRLPPAGSPRPRLSPVGPPRPRLPPAVHPRPRQPPAGFPRPRLSLSSVPVTPTAPAGHSPCLPWSIQLRHFSCVLSRVPTSALVRIDTW